MVIAAGAQGGELGLRGVFGSDGLDFPPGAQGEAGGKVGGHRHARDDLHVDAAFLHQDLADGIMAISPAELAAISSRISRLAAGGERQAGMGLAPAGSEFAGGRAGCRGMNEDPIGGLRLPVFKVGVAGGG